MKFYFAFFLAFASCAAALGEIPKSLDLPPVFGDHMVLQRDLRLPIWGKAAAGETVAVDFGGQQKMTIADRDGNWRVSLDAMPANNEPRTLRVTSGTAAKTIADVLVGEVWICAGQSNMEFPLAKEQHAAEELPKSGRSGLRLLNMTFTGQFNGRKGFRKEDAEQFTPARFYRGIWRVSSPESAQPFSAIGYYYGKELHEKLGVPVGLIHLAIGGSPTEAWIRREALAANPQLKPLVTGEWLDNKMLGPWCLKRAHENLDPLLRATGAVPHDALGPNHPFKPSFLWEAGIAKLLPFGIRGVIWYQGESNSLEAWRVQQHERLFPLLVCDWRAQWGQGDFPFYFCQLSGIEATGYQSQFWPEFRDSQRRMAAALPNVGMAVTSDLGDRHDVHPRNKRDVGHRLALLALAKTYKVPVEFSGPTPVATSLEDGNLVIHFDHAEQGLRTQDGGSLRGFEIAAADGDFCAADARIEGSRVVLSNSRIARPQRARSAWQPFPDANLVNASALPCSTFQSQVIPTP